MRAEFEHEKLRLCAAELLRARLQSLPDELREKINAWLSGPRDFRQQLFRLGTASSLPAGTRGAKPVASAAPAVSSDGDGIYRFTLDQPASFRFSMELPAEPIKPLCLVILSAEDNSFSQVYPLSQLGKSSLRVRDVIELPAGNYILCVLRAGTAPESGGSVDA